MPYMVLIIPRFIKKSNNKTVAFLQFLEYNVIVPNGHGIYMRKADIFMSILTEKYGFKEADPSALCEMDFNPYKKIDKEWFLVTAGGEQGWNTMTASWGFAGIMWAKPTFTTVIRPQRYTKEFIDKADTFSICFFDESERKALAFCGSNSGRDCDKAASTGLTPVFTDDTTVFEQAKLVLICEKAYVQPMTAESFVNKTLNDQNYAAGDHHTQYIGIIKKVYVK